MGELSATSGSGSTFTLPTVVMQAWNCTKGKPENSQRTTSNQSVFLSQFLVSSIGHLSGIYRASIGDVSGIYRKNPTDGRLKTET